MHLFAPVLFGSCIILIDYRVSLNIVSSHSSDRSFFWLSLGLWCTRTHLPNLFRILGRESLVGVTYFGFSDPHFWPAFFARLIPTSIHSLCHVRRIRYRSIIDMLIGLFFLFILKSKVFSFDVVVTYTHAFRFYFNHEFCPRRF